MGTIEQLIDRVVGFVSNFFSANPELANTLLLVLFGGFLLYVFLYDDDTPRASDRYHGYGERGCYDDSWDSQSSRRYGGRGW